jgi:hypothetical protein
MSARLQLRALVEVEREEQVDELVRLAANAEVGLTVYSEPGGEEGDHACANCLAAHGPLDNCALGVLASVVRDRWEGRGDRPAITSELLEAINADDFWDLLCPALDWLERELRRAAR